ncbi:MAG: HAMP domain-containing histidine kinase [Sedimentisphaerales bacterium]|nr:HAMP domain-containing histidine kinase [Sedimentisphaerales bacterium]
MEKDGAMGSSFSVGEDNKEYVSEKSGLLSQKDVQIIDSLDMMLDCNTLRLSIHDNNGEIIYASQSTKDLYKSLTGNSFSAGKCYNIYHGINNRCHDCPFVLFEKYQFEEAVSKLSKRKPFCENRISKSTPFYIEHHPKFTNGKIVGNIEVIRETPQREYDQLYDLATKLNSADLPDELYDLTIIRFRDLGFPGVRLYLALNDSILVGKRRIFKEGPPQDYELKIIKGHEHYNEGSFLCFNSPIKPTFVFIDSQKAKLPECSRDIDTVGLRIKYIPEDTDEEFFGKRLGWFDAPLEDNGTIVGKITCDITEKTFLYRDDVHTISVFSKLFAQAIVNQQNRLRAAQRSSLLNAHETATPLQFIGDNLVYIQSKIRKQNEIDKDLEHIFEDTESVIAHATFLNTSGIHLITGSNNYEGVSLHTDVCLPIVKMFRRNSNKSGIKIVFAEGFTDMPILYVDKIALQRVFHNLLRNAFKYSEPNTDIKILLNTENGWIISVSNWGLPIPEEYKDKIFEDGFRTEEARRLDFGGTGLGLYLCKKIICALGGNIFVSHCKGPVIISFTLPRKLADSDWYKNNEDPLH